MNMTRMMKRVRVVLGVILLCAGNTVAGVVYGGATGPLQTDSAEGSPNSVSLPFVLSQNRMIIDVRFLLNDGSVRNARAWVDLGSQDFAMAESLAQDLGYELSGLQRQKHSTEVPGRDLSMCLNGFPLRTEGVRVFVHPGAVVRAGVPAEVNLPASILHHYHVVFDYSTMQITIATQGVVIPEGETVPCHINSETGLVMVPVVIDGDTVQLGVDNGAAGTWVSNDLIAVWRGRHHEWPHAVGAAGSANFFGFPFELDGVLMCLPEMRVGSMHIANVAILGLDQDLFDWYSMKSAGPVMGFLGGNVLRHFRLEIDFADQMSYWRQASVVGPADLDIVGVTLRPEEDGGISIAGVVLRKSGPVEEGFDPGDRLLRVDGKECNAAGMGAVIDALRGMPGSVKKLEIEREGERRTVEATVVRLP